MNAYLWICVAWFSFSAFVTLLLIAHNKSEAGGIRALRSVMLLFETGWWLSLGH